MLSNLNFFYFYIGFNPILSIALLESLVWFDPSYRSTMCVIGKMIDEAINYIWSLLGLVGVIFDEDNTIETTNPDGSVEVIVYE